MNQFQAFLKGHGVELVEAVGEPFDPNVHEAVAQVTVDEGQSGVVVSEEVRGYTFKGKLLRPARVVVGKAPEAEEEQAESDG